MGVDIYTSAIYGINIGDYTEDLIRKIQIMLSMDPEDENAETNLQELLEMLRLRRQGFPSPNERGDQNIRDYYITRNELLEKPRIQAIPYGSYDGGWILGVRYKDLGEPWEPHAIEPDDLHPTDDEIHMLMNFLREVGITDVEPQLFISSYYSY
jgi:hypothetical protein